MPFRKCWESFNGSLRDECLNTNWLLSIEDAQDKLEAQRVDYNEYRPHSSLDSMTPEAFARSMAVEANHKAIIEVNEEGTVAVGGSFQGFQQKDLQISQ